MPTLENWTLDTQPVPEPGAGQILVKAKWLSVDPYMRGRMSPSANYTKGVAIGEIVQGGGVGEVVASNHPAWKVGEIAELMSFGWQEWSVLTPGLGTAGVNKIDPNLAPIESSLSWLGMPGLTAYFGLLDVGRPRPGETVVVSAASGAVGQFVGQIAKIKGCRAVGIAGGTEKCNWLTQELGFDAAVDYKRPGWRDAFVKATPDGVHVNFENVGGEIMETVMRRMTLGGRMPLCGLISGYNGGTAGFGDFSSILMRRLSVRCFIVIDFAARWEEATSQLNRWVREGKLKHRETIVEGLENAPAALNQLFDGANIGRLMVKVAEAGSQ